MWLTKVVVESSAVTMQISYRRPPMYAETGSIQVEDGVASDDEAENVGIPISSDQLEEAQEDDDDGGLSSLHIWSATIVVWSSIGVGQRCGEGIECTDLHARLAN